MPIGLPIRARPVGRLVGAEHLEKISYACPVGHAGVIRTSVEGRSFHEKFFGVIGRAKLSVGVAGNPTVGRKEREHHIGGAGHRAKALADVRQISRHPI